MKLSYRSAQLPRDALCVRWNLVDYCRAVSLNIYFGPYLGIPSSDFYEIFRVCGGDGWNPPNKISGKSDEPILGEGGEIWNFDPHNSPKWAPAPSFFIQICEIAFEKSYSTWTTLKITQGHRNCRYRWAIYHFLLVFCSNSVSVLHRFRDITTFCSVRDCLWPWEVLQFR